MIGFHFQNTVDNWPEAVAKLPPRGWIKAVDNVQLLAEAKGHNPQVKTVLRHWYDWGQQFDGGIEGNKTRARDFFASFIDGTFDNYAPQVDAIEGFNEYLANSQNAAEVQQRIDWVTAVSQVWSNEYRTQSKYAHIQLVIANAAIGNDIPVEFAAVAQQYDCLMGYHPYIPVKDHQVLPGEWPNYSGRFTEMDKRFKAAGYTVQWLFTEGGAVRYDQDLGNGFTNSLDPQGGWRMGGVCNADPESYLNVLRYWLDNVSAWNQANNNRALGVVLFTSGGGDAWKWFEVKQPEMNMIADLAATYELQEPDPDPPTPPPTGPPSGEPREQYKRVYWVVPQDVSKSEWLEICDLAHADKRTVGFSYDDAGIGALNDKTAVLWGIEDEQLFLDWYDTNYPGTKVEFMDLPSSLEIVDIVNTLPKHDSKTYGSRSLSEITTLVIHHTVSPPDRAISSIASFHVNSNDWPGIGYHYVIKDTGEIFQTNYLETRSYHAGGANGYTVGIALQGDFTLSPPPSKQLQAAVLLVDWLQNKLDIEAIVPHRELSQTACPGATWEQWFPLLT